MQQQLKELAKDLLDADFKKLSPRKKEILTNIAEETPISEDVNREFSDNLTFGERLSDSIAQFGGSWKFIILAIITLTAWICLNSYALFLDQPFDPFPYILLNLGLSMLAALQAPFILMSQNRQAEKDRLKTENNFKTTLKIELEITRLHQRLDDFFKSQDSYKNNSN